MSRSVLVTGGNRGIGLAIARRLAAGGDSVTITSRSGEKVDGLTVAACDVRDLAQVDAAFSLAEEAHGPVEVVVSNAGITRDQLLALMSEDSFADVLDTNLTGSYRVAKRAVRNMMKLRRGRLIFISSVVGLLGSGGQANYASSKAGLVGLARSLARELGSRNITANVVAPGFVDTDMTSALPADRQKAILAGIPLGRMASADEVAAAVAFLAGPAAALQRELREVSGGLPLEPIRTMHQVVAASSARTEFYIMLMIPFAVIALLLAAVGLYGLMAYSVEQRTQEIGVRMALGAGPEDVRFMVVLQGMRLAFLGILIGIPAALALTRVMVGMIFGIPTWDPAVFAAVALLLSAVALFATYAPAVRATRIDPMDALRG